MPAPALDQTFGALSDPVRRSIVMALSRGPKVVKDIAAPFSISRPAISKHLRILLEAGIVESTPMGRQNRYSITESAFEDANGWLDEIQDMWVTALVSLKQFVEEANNASSE